MELVEFLRQRAIAEGLSFKTVLKEALQVLFLEELYKLPESSNIVFQGGTCLRLVYGGPRYSDDIDFVTNKSSEELAALYNKIKEHLHKLGPLLSGRIESRIQKESAKLTRWKLYYLPNDQKETTSVNIEFADYPFYTQELLPLNLPQGYPVEAFIVINAESLEEILADKLVAVVGRKYLKGRDVFDLWFLKTKNTNINYRMALDKLNDYSISKSDVTFKDISVEVVAQDLKNFLPKDLRDKFEQEAYKTLLKTAQEFLKGFHQSLK